MAVATLKNADVPDEMALRRPWLPGSASFQGQRQLSRFAKEDFEEE